MSQKLPLEIWIRTSWMWAFNANREILECQGIDPFFACWAVWALKWLMADPRRRSSSVCPNIDAAWRKQASEFKNMRATIVRYYRASSGCGPEANWLILLWSPSNKALEPEQKVNYQLAITLQFLVRYCAHITLVIRNWEWLFLCSRIHRAPGQSCGDSTALHKWILGGQTS